MSKEWKQWSSNDRSIIKCTLTETKAWSEIPTSNWIAKQDIIFVLRFLRSEKYCHEIDCNLLVCKLISEPRSAHPIYIGKGMLSSEQLGEWMKGGWSERGSSNWQSIEWLSSIIWVIGDSPRWLMWSVNVYVVCACVCVGIWGLIVTPTKFGHYITWLLRAQ